MCATLSGTHNYLGRDSQEFYFLWGQPCRLHLKNFAGGTAASTDSLSASSLAAFFVAGRANKTL
jgi:hypothetical protein